MNSRIVCLYEIGPSDKNTDAGERREGGNGGDWRGREERTKKKENRETLFRGISSPERRGALNFWEIRKIALRQERKGMLPVLREGEIWEANEKGCKSPGEPSNSSSAGCCRKLSDEKSGQLSPTEKAQSRLVSKLKDSSWYFEQHPGAVVGAAALFLESEGVGVEALAGRSCTGER